MALWGYSLMFSHPCIWYRLAASCDAILTGSCQPPVWGRNGRMGVRDGSHE